MPLIIMCLQSIQAAFSKTEIESDLLKKNYFHSDNNAMIFKENGWSCYLSHEELGTVTMAVRNIEIMIFIVSSMKLSCYISS